MVIIYFLWERTAVTLTPEDFIGSSETNSEFKVINCHTCNCQDLNIKMQNTYISKNNLIRVYLHFQMVSKFIGGRGKNLVQALLKY